MNDLQAFLQQEIATFIHLRHDIHQHPELAFNEYRTSDLVAKLLTEWGYTVERNIGGTGLVAQLKQGESSRTIGIRADMDALPIEEETNIDYCSVEKGKMHACGHDGHTVILLAAAKALATRRRFNGTVNLIFQPAEEVGVAHCGAAQMIEDGLFAKYPCDAIYGMHNMPGYPQGQLHFFDGAMMASSDKATITLHGPGGHGAQPQKTPDPIVATASLVMALQTVVARNVSPLDSAVVTIGMMQAGTANNIIPQQAQLVLSIRCFKPDVRDLLQKRIVELAQAQAQSFGLTAEVVYERGYPPLYNTLKETDFARKIAKQILPPEAVVENTIPMTGSEDFAYMLEQCPGSYLFIGNGVNEPAYSHSLHNPGYNFNDKNILVGAMYWTALAENFLQ
ncbi:M20 family metallopeptidase [Neisseriaceae bacterium ESL0693]|nr:M20 family metallopeptidase [Neisseriaceae bacterium ESL0693]